ncbi:MAG: hypothetical protein U5R30_14620 [Deltaproteobacteria bacterium]|nr:hypothetical protein [Deltaproteobacteria bacterium]
MTIRAAGKTAVCRAKEVAQGGGTELGAAHHPLLQLVAEERDVFQHAQADGGGPVGQLVPGEQVSGEVGCQHEDEKTQTDDPVHPARGSKSAGEENPQAVQAQNDHEKIGAPEMDVADELSEGQSRLQANQRIVGLGGKRLVGELQQDAGEKLQRHQHHGRAA